MIDSSLSSTLSSVKHILQDVNRKAQNHTCKQSLKEVSARDHCSGQSERSKCYLRADTMQLTVAVSREVNYV